MFDKSLNLDSVRAHLSQQQNVQKALISCRSHLLGFKSRWVAQKPKEFESFSTLGHHKLTSQICNETVATWNTAAGQIKTSERCVVHFSLPEFSPTSTIAWDMHVRTLDNTQYDMIIGNDLLECLKIVDLKFSTSTINWDGIEIPMQSKDATLEEYIINKSPSLHNASRQVKEILDAKYEPVNLKVVTATCTNLDNEQRKDLHTLLKKYESLFDGTLGQ
jgi:hypothetical protein